MDSMQFFSAFWDSIKQTSNWETMVKTVEASPWHREANVAVHTTMTLEQYQLQFYEHRTERQRILTMMALLFHDFGKPEAEETLEKKEEPGVFYRRYAGHEPISGNVFLSFMCDNDKLRQMFFDQGFSWKDIRTIKVMIEHHLPYGLKNTQKRQRLKQMIDVTLGQDVTCFYDMLRSDCHGRISDDHETKKQNVEEWITEFQAVTYKPRVVPKNPELIMLVGISGAGKSTYIKNMVGEFQVFNEDDLRLVYAREHMPAAMYQTISGMSTADHYQLCWNFCHLVKIEVPEDDSPKRQSFDQFSSAEFEKLLATGKTIVVDRMNHGRKARGKYIEGAKAKGYKVRSVEFFISESKAQSRQKNRGDKSLSDRRVHEIAMQLETPWLGAEVDSMSIYIS